jgi:hypothetical protein
MYSYKKKGYNIGMTEPKLKGKKVKGIVKILKALPYKGHMVYIRRIYQEYFEYLLEYNGEIYSAYIIITPAKGKKRLSKSEVDQCSALVNAGAESTLDALLGDKAESGVAEAVVKAGEEIQNATSV